MRQLLEQTVLLPCVFAVEYDTIPNINLYHLKKILFDYCIVCDTPDFSCAKMVLEYAKSGNTRTHQHAKEVIEKLRKQGRLLPLVYVSKTRPTKADCFLDKIALLQGSKDCDVFSNCLIPKCTKTGMTANNANIHDMALLHKSNWLNKERNSVRLDRSIDHFTIALQLLLESSKSVNFIDPYLDPSRHDYKEFYKIFSICNNNPNCSEINIHRVCYTDSGTQREVKDKAYWESVFRKDLQKYNTNNKASVYIWPDFHDRYILTNLMGFSLPYGISTTKDSSELTGKTIWTKLSFNDNINLQMVFNESKLKNNNINSYKFQL